MYLSKNGDRQISNDKDILGHPNFAATPLTTEMLREHSALLHSA
jgi:hypothetical protein